MTALYWEHSVQTSLSDHNCADKIPQHEACDNKYHHGKTLIVLYGHTVMRAEEEAVNGIVL